MRMQFPCPSHRGCRGALVGEFGRHFCSPGGRPHALASSVGMLTFLEAGFPGK